jgi:AcrR family transcriptional regulator
MAIAAVPNKHQQKSEATRRKLLAAARRVFALRGFEAARIEDIAAESGYTRGAFYANFDSKEALFLALLEQQVSEHVARITQRLQSCSDDAEKISALRDYYLGLASDRQSSMLMLEFKLFAVRHPRLRAKLARAHRQIRAAAKSQTRGLFASDKNWSDEPTGISLEGSLHGLVLQHAYDPEALNEEQMLSALGRIFDILRRSLISA